MAAVESTAGQIAGPVRPGQNLPGHLDGPLAQLDSQ
jgi:hypothetical protein